jgi:hypothetical protein
MSERQNTGNVKERLAVFLFGGISSSTATLFSNPLDTVKIRLQIQGAAGLPSIYRNSFHALYKIPQQEGIAALQKGLQPAFIRQFFYGALRFGIYQTLKNQVLVTDSDAINACGAYVSGYLAALICTPLDLLKVRLQGDQIWGEKYKNHIFTNIARIYKETGASGMYTGWAPTAIRGGLVATAEFTSYDHIKRFVTTKTPVKDGFWAHLLVGSCSGFFGAFISNPIDVLKSRMMNQRPEEPRYLDTMDCLKRTVRKEGILSLYKGLIANSIRNIPQVAITFICLEQLVKQYQLQRL